MVNQKVQQNFTLPLALWLEKQNLPDVSLLLDTGMTNSIPELHDTN